MTSIGHVPLRDAMKSRCSTGPVPIVDAAILEGGVNRLTFIVPGTHATPSTSPVPYVLG